VDATDAEVTVNNVQATSSTNTLTDVVPGVTLTLNDENEDKVVRVTVSRDPEGLRKQVDGFVKAYNDLVRLGERPAHCRPPKARPAWGAKAVVRGLHSDLRGSHSRTSTAAAGITRLAAVGIGFDRSGMMTVDASRVRKGGERTTPPPSRSCLPAPADGATDGAFDVPVRDDLPLHGCRADWCARRSSASRTRSSRSPAAWTSSTPSSRLRRNALQAEFIACRSSHAAPQQSGQLPDLTRRAIPTLLI
jgi:hypothetical protein